MSDDASAVGRLAVLARPSGKTLVTVTVVVMTLALNLAQQPGLITFDTKLDLQFNPGGFMKRSLSLWNGDWAFGGLQNQASGYLLPMGPVFLLGDALGVPMWVWERLWSSAVMLLAYAGARRLASHWPGIGQIGAVLAGLTYMLAPRVLTTVGGMSGETLPAAVLPWTLLPLVLYLRGKLTGRIAFLWSGATVSWMGGQNATVVLACLLLPAMLLAFTEGRTWRRRLHDLVVWGSFVVMATLWWLVPLFLLGGYSPPFLGFIESSATTAASTGWLSSLRGTVHWVAFFPGGGSAGWSGGYALASSATLLVTTALTAGAGILGLARSDLWARRVLMAGVLVGLAVLTAGSGMPAGSAWAAPWLEALDTWLAPLRNVHKFDPLVRLPLSLGVGAFASTGIQHLVARVRRVPTSRVGPVALALSAVLGLAVVAAVQPAAAGKLRTDGGMEDLSSAWRSTADFLSAQSGPVGVLVLPGAGSAVQYWGRSVDEPIQMLDGPPWSARSQITVAPAGTLRLMNSIEDHVARGRPLDGLSDMLRRLGMTHVVVRSDLDPEETDAPPPGLVYASLTGAGDLRSVARFGRMAEGHPAVEVFALDDAGEDPRVSVTDWADRRVVQGGPEVVNDLVSAGLVGAGQATVLAGGRTGPSADIVTDSNQRIERSFGRVHGSTSGVMTEAEPFRRQRPMHDYAGDEIPDAQTTAQYDGAELITASSSSAYADTLGPVRSAEHPYAAFDDSVFTSWASAPITSPEGQWIEVRFDEPVEPGPIDLQFDPGRGAKVRSVRLTTDDGSRTVPVTGEGRASAIELRGTTTSFVRLTVVKATGGASQVRLADFRLRHHEIRRSLKVPGKVTGRTAVHLSSDLSRRACVTAATGVICDQSWQRETPETTGFDRTVEVDESGSWRLEGRVVSTHGPAAERLLAPLSSELVSVTSTSTFAGDPAVAAAFAFDGRVETGWYSSPLDEAPGLQLSWRKKRVIHGLVAVLGKDQPGALPTTLVVDPLTGAKPQLVATTGPKAGQMSPVRTNRLRVSVLPEPGRSEGVGISELEITGLEDLRHNFDPQGKTGLVCGFGPTVEIDGTTIPTQVTGTLGDVRTGAELKVQPCGPAAARITAGTQRIRVTNPAGFAVSRLWLVPETDTADAPPPPSTTSSQVTSWSPTDRTVEVQTEREAVIALAQSSNRGWEATVDGSRLEPVVIDGWKQGWRVPAGTSGAVVMGFAPQATFRLGIVLGLLVAGFLTFAALVMLLVGQRRPRRPRENAGRPRGDLSRDADSAGARWHRVALVAGAGILAFVSVALSIGAVVGFVTRRASFAALALCCTVALLVAVMLAISDGQIVVPPNASDVIVALVVGGVAGRVFSGEALVEERR